MISLKQQNAKIFAHTAKVVARITINGFRKLRTYLEKFNFDLKEEKDLEIQLNAESKVGTNFEI
jgi:hypothetical protein